MHTRMFGVLGSVSALCLGGGGIGLLWGPTTREEAKATISEALDGGIDLLDTAPSYGACEALIGELFGGRLPSGVRVTSKCQLGSPPPSEVEGVLDASLTATLAAMRLSRVDVFFLHSNICADDYVYANRPDLLERMATRWSLYVEKAVPTLEHWRNQGRIGAWGITGTGVPASIMQALRHTPRPQVVQVITNLLDSPGAMRRYTDAPEPRRIAAVANECGVPVMGIRAVQAGALTAAIDRELSPNHPELKDFERAAPFRAFCGRIGQDPATIAHRYALSLPGVSTIVLGVKNRDELRACLRAEADGPLEPTTVAEIDALGLRAS